MAYRITSPDTIDYNCAAWAAEESEMWWWPDAQNLYYWPPDIPREVTLQPFMQAYGQLGYERYAAPELEVGLQKIAIYADQNNVPVHVAR
ncbi:MAG: hypothetical protein AAGD25_20090 [Cyanobacteria bacterium P01_F01_bin.150]